MDGTWSGGVDHMNSKTAPQFLHTVSSSGSRMPHSGQNSPRTAPQLHILSSCPTGRRHTGQVGRTNCRKGSPQVGHFLSSSPISVPHDGQLNVPPSIMKMAPQPGQLPASSAISSLQTGQRTSSSTGGGGGGEGLSFGALAMGSMTCRVVVLSRPLTAYVLLQYGQLPNLDKQLEWNTLPEPQVQNSEPSLMFPMQIRHVRVWVLAPVIMIRGRSGLSPSSALTRRSLTSLFISFPIPVPRNRALNGSAASITARRAEFPFKQILSIFLGLIMTLASYLFTF